MALELADHWVWDSWLADDGEHYHLFFLRASRALHEPVRRHRRASLGHARSRDLREWELLPDALVRADEPAFDDIAIWTGSVIRGPDRLWRLFYTGVSRADAGNVQRIGVATSADLITWHRSDRVLLEADGRWYEKLADRGWPEEAWRDPYVFADPDGGGWHMLITARGRSGPVPGRGVIGYAHSPDLEDWTIGPPRSEPAGFGHLEVPQSYQVEGRHVLVFSCLAPELMSERRAGWNGGGVWLTYGSSATGPWDLAGAVALDHPSLYAGRLVQDRDRAWHALGFRHDEDGEFVGAIADPLPLIVSPSGIQLAR